MSVAGCYTDFHIDFGGTSVWYHILHGEKVSTKSVQKNYQSGSHFTNTLKEGFTPIFSATLSYGKSVSP